MKNWKRIALVGLIAALSAGPVSATDWHKMTPYLVVFKGGNFEVGVISEPVSIGGTVKRELLKTGKVFVDVGKAGVTAEGARRLFSLVLAAQLAGRKIKCNLVNDPGNANRFWTNGCHMPKS